MGISLVKTRQLYNSPTTISIFLLIMEHSLPMSGHIAPAFNTTNRVRSPSVRAALKTLHIYCHDHSNTPYAFLQRLQSLYGRIQRAAISDHRGKRATGAYPQQRVANRGLNSGVYWILKAEFTTLQNAANAYSGILSDPGSGTVAYFHFAFVLEEEDSLVDLSQVSNAQDAGRTTSSSHMMFQNLHNTIQSRERLNSK
jgi:hypothetical protein